MENTPVQVLIEYVRVQRGPKKGQLKGVVVATDNKGIGWSCVNTKAGDIFDKNRGIEIALSRRKEGTKKQIPYDVMPVINRMKIRADKYFKPVCV